MGRLELAAAARWLAPLVAALLFGALAANAHADAPAFAERAWVQLTDRGPEARLVTQSAECPAIMVDGAARPMQRRAGATADFPVTVCQARIPAVAHRVVLDGHALPLPRAPRRIVIFGDTGCRLKG